MRTVKFLFVMMILLTEAGITTLDAQSRFNSEADSLDWWHNRRFKLSGVKPYTKVELDSMKAEALRKGTPTVVQQRFARAMGN